MCTQGKQEVGGREIPQAKGCHSRGIVVLQWCYSGFTVVLQCSGGTLVSQWFYSGVTIV
jgi:hypothetical protein